MELDHLLTDGENGVLNPLGVNCLRAFPIYGNVGWGARTLTAPTSMASRVEVRAGAPAGAVHRGEPLPRHQVGGVRAQRRAAVGADPAQRRRLHAATCSARARSRARTPREAYFVKCDAETTTQTDIDHGIVNIVVGFAPLKPAEFVIIKIQQLAGQIQA